MTLAWEAFRLYQRYIKRRRYERYAALVAGREKHFSDFYLDAALAYARANIPYYRAAASEAQGLADFPLLNKSIIAGNFSGLQAGDLTARRWYKNTSGGSTGEPVALLQDDEYAEWAFASELYYYRNFLDCEPDSVPSVVLWGSERDIFSSTGSLKLRMINKITQTHFFNSFLMTPEQYRGCVGAINSIKPHFIKGYAGSLYQLAKFIKENNLSVHRPAFVYSAAETLLPFMRALIEEIFGCKVYNYYGSREVGAIAGECRCGSLHVFSFNTALEVLGADDKPVPAGGEGRVVVTTLHNRTMPLVRYEIGDNAVPVSGCTCGSPLPALKAVSGRVTDNFLAKTGATVHGEYFTHLFYFRDWIKEFQVVQEDVSRIRIYAALRGTKPSPLEIAEIESKIFLVMGSDCTIIWEYVPQAPRTPHGKWLFTRSLINGPQRTA